ncbi:MAG TPA: BTAD domain-containing putative transcriptional regulator, partial [Micromonosporaceae bacterium]
MRVDTVGLVSVHGPSGTISGAALGGRRARVAIVALAFADGPLPAERLASMIWAGNPPPSWNAALRGVIRALRTAVAPIGVGAQQLVSTVPTGYVLGPGVVTDVGAAREAIGEATRLLAGGRFREAASSAAAAARLDGAALLADEDLEWLDPYRAAITQTRMRALAALAEAASGLGDTVASVEHAQAAVALSPMD